MDNIISWRINNGNSLFWWDDWTGHGSLNSLISPAIEPMNEKVKDYINDHVWDLDKVKNIIPDNFTNMINEVNIGNGLLKGQATWKITPMESSLVPRHMKN